MLFTYVLELTLLLLASQFFFGTVTYGQFTNPEVSDVDKMLHAMAENFKSKIDEEFSHYVDYISDHRPVLARFFIF